MPGKLVSDITAFDVTYANVLAPVGFHKAMTAKDDCVSADITNGIEGAQVTNLWYAQKDDEEDPIVNIDIIYDEEETPYGFTKVNKDLVGGLEDEKSYIIYQRASQYKNVMGGGDNIEELLPLCSVKIAFSKEFEAIFLPGYEKVHKNILRTKGEAFLFFRRRKITDKTRWHPRHLKLKDLCDAFDEYGSWCFAQIIEMNNPNFPGMAKVHYTRWLGPKYDEWLPLNKRRFAPYNTKPKKKTEVKIGRPWQLEVNDVTSLIKTLVEIQNDPDAIDKECEVSLILMVDRFLRKKLVPPPPPTTDDDYYDYDDNMGRMDSGDDNDDDKKYDEESAANELKNTVYQFFRKIVQIGVWMLKDRTRIRAKFISILRKVLFANKDFAFFFENEGYNKSGTYFRYDTPFVLPEPIDYSSLLGIVDNFDEMKIESETTAVEDDSTDKEQKKKEDNKKTKLFIETTGSLNRRLKGNSLYYSALFNYFAEIGGLDSIISILDQDKDDENRVSLKVVEDLVAIVCAPKKYYTNSKWTKEFIVEFQQKLEKRLAELSKKELQKLDDACVNNILDTSEQLFLQVDDDFSGDKRREIYNLNLIKRVLCCSTLNKRIEAIDNLLTYIRLTEERDRRKRNPVSYNFSTSTSYNSNYSYSNNTRYSRNNNRGYNNNDDEGIKVKWLTPKTLAEWMDEQGILYIIIQGSPENRVAPHVAIATKALVGGGDVTTSLFQFLAKQERIDEESINELWKMAMDPNETTAMKDIIFKSLETVIPFLKKDLYQHVSGKIHDITMEQLNESTIKLVSSLCVVPTPKKKSRTKKLMSFNLFSDNNKVANKSMPRAVGAKLLWMAVQDEAELANDLKDVLCKEIKKILSSDIFQYDEILEDMIKNVDENKSMKRTMLLLQQLVESVGEDDLEKVNEFLFKKHALKDKVIRSLGNCKNVQQLSNRLNFLAFLFDGKGKMGAEETLSLWDTLISMEPKFRIVFFEWLSAKDCCSDAGEDAIYDQRLCGYFKSGNWDIDVYPAFKCFMLLFLSINSKNNTLERKTEGRRNDDDLVKNVMDLSRINGIDTLWEILTHNVNPGGDHVGVSKTLEKCVKLYTHLLTRVEVLEEKKEIWTQFVVTCMDKLNNLSVKSPASCAGIVLALKSFISSIENTRMEINPTGSPHQLLYARVLVEWSGGAKYGGTIDNFNPQRGMHHVLYDDGQKRWYEIEEDRDGNLQGNNEKGAHLFEIVRLDDAVLNDPEIVTMRHLPQQIIVNNEEYFSSLFKLLSISTVESSVWSLLTENLPTNQKILVAIHDCGKLELPVKDGYWEYLLGNIEDAPLRFLYSLRIVGGFGLPMPGSSFTETRDCERFCESFIRSGGFSYIYSLIIDSKHAISKFSKPSLSSECLNLILRILNQCYYIIVSNPAIQVELEMDVAQTRMCSKILELIVDAYREDDGDDGNNRNANDDGDRNNSNVVFVDLPPSASNNEWSQDGTLKVANAISVIDAQEDRALSSLISDTEELISPMLSKTPLYNNRVGNNVSTLIDAFSLITSILGLRGGSSKALLAFLSEPLLLEACGVYLLQSKQKKVREAFAFKLYQLIELERNGNSGIGKLCEMLLSLLGRIAKARVSNGLEYFHFLISILRSDRALDGVDIPHVAETCALKIASFNSNHGEDIVAEDGGEGFLQGISAVLVVLLDRKECAGVKIKEKLGLSKSKGGLDLCNRIYDHCLSTDEKKIVKGSNISETRKLSFKLLSSLADNCTSNAEAIADLLKDRHQFKNENEDDATTTESTAIVCGDPGGAYSNRYDRNGPKASCGFVGLKNLGCVCYMNSTLQNLFMCNAFRRQMFNVDIKKIPNQNDLMDSVIYQVQKMFSYLQESQKRYFNPGGFCYAFKDPERPGMPTPTREQRDASGFYLGLLNSIRDTCVTTEYNEQVISNFQMQSMLELSATAGDGTKLKKLNKKAKDNMLSVRVRDLSGLEESLDNYFAGEQVDGYKWERENGEEERLPTLKRDTIKTLPETLVFHLQRFETDYMMDPPQTKKINSRFVIPQTLDMTKYTLEGRTMDEDNKPLPHPDEYYQFELHGITIHTGTANGGHYYSYARERGSYPANWMCFNDEKVKKWSVDNLERDCFGGETERNGRKYQNMANAFMVFYERKKKIVSKDGKSGSSREVSHNGANVTLDEESKSSDSLGAGVMAVAAVGKMLHNTEEFRNSLKTRSLIPSYLYGEIYKENVTGIYEEQTGNVEYFSFIDSLLDLPLESGGDARTKICKLSVSFVLTTVLKSKDDALVATWIDKLKEIISVEKDIAAWLLDLVSNNPKVLEIILGQNERKITTLSTQLIAESLNTVYENSNENLVNAFVKFLLEDLLLVDVDGSTISNSSKWKFSVFTNFFANSASYTPSNEIFKLVVSLVEKRNSELDGDLMQIISKLLEIAHSSTSDTSKVEKVESNFEIIASDIIILFAIENINNVDVKDTAETIIYNIARRNAMTFIRALSVVEKWADTDTTMYRTIPLLYKIYRIFLKVLDKRLLQGENLKESVLMTMLNVINANKNYWIFTVKGVFEMLQLAARRKDLLSWLYSNTDRFDWLRQWFKDNDGRRTADRVTCEYLYKGESAYDRRRDIMNDADNLDTVDIYNMVTDALANKSPDLRGYFPEDEANPESMIGRRIEVRWSSRTAPLGFVFCPGTVSKYDPDTNMHEVLYDDGDSRKYNFKTKSRDSFTVLGLARKPRREEL